MGASSGPLPLFVAAARDAATAAAAFDPLPAFSVTTTVAPTACTWYNAEFAFASSCASASTSENGQPSSRATLSFTKSSGCGGFWSSKYLFSCQVFTTPPRFDSSTRYSALSTTTVFSSLASTTEGFAAAAVPPDFAALVEDAFPGASACAEACCEP